MLPHEMKFIVPNYSCLQNPWLGGNRFYDALKADLSFDKASNARFETSAVV